MHDDILRHQSLLIDALAAAERMFATAQPVTPASVSALRQEVRTLLSRYRTCALAHLDRLIAAGEGPGSDIAARLRARCLAIGEDYGALMRRWPADAAEAAPDTYRADGLAFAERLRLHLMLERYDLEDLAPAPRGAASPTGPADHERTAPRSARGGTRH